PDLPSQTALRLVRRSHARLSLGISVGPGRRGIPATFAFTTADQSSRSRVQPLLFSRRPAACFFSGNPQIRRPPGCTQKEWTKTASLRLRFPQALPLPSTTARRGPPTVKPLHF